MIDFHTHSLFSDGELLPSELVRRVEVQGYSFIAITDHVDSSNIDLIVPRLVKVAKDINKYSQTKLIPGVELTHVGPSLIPSLAKEARKIGAKLVLVHGETIAEPVAPGTNRAALESAIDILAHPGLITKEEVILAAEKGIFLEITNRKGHCLTNGHVARLGLECKAKFCINSDGHAPGDFMSASVAEKTALGSGIPQEMIKTVYSDMAELAKRCFARSLSDLR
ncbi:MAG: histidinol phosphate phosphatase domain-containing protein [Pseudomonadota bacterium]